MIIEVYLRSHGEVILYSKDLMFNSDLPLGIVCCDIYNNPLKKLFKPVDFTYKLYPNIILDGVVSLGNLNNLDNIEYTHISICFDIERESMNSSVNYMYRYVRGGYYKIHCFEVLEEKFTEFVVKRFDEIFRRLSHFSDYVTCYLFKSFILKHYPKKDLQEIDFYLRSKVFANKIVNQLVYDPEYL